MIHLLEIRNLSKTFNANTLNENQIYSKFSLRVKEGDFITIIGSNGAGKSTLLNIISGAIGIDEGSIELKGVDISALPEHRRTEYIGRVFQDPSMGVAPSMTILENLSMAYSKGKNFSLSMGIRKKDINHFKEVLSQLSLGIEDMLENKAGLLSGGQRQALSLIMATLAKPRLLILDEHTAALDPKTSERIIQLTQEIVMKNKITTLMVTHNIQHAIKVGNRLLMLHRGKIILDVNGDAKNSLSVENILAHFEKNANKESLGDRTLLA